MSNRHVSAYNVSGIDQLLQSCSLKTSMCPSIAFLSHQLNTEDSKVPLLPGSKRLCSWATIWKASHWSETSVMEFIQTLKKYLFVKPLLFCDLYVIQLAMPFPLELPILLHILYLYHPSPSNILCSITCYFSPCVFCLEQEWTKSNPWAKSNLILLFIYIALLKNGQAIHFCIGGIVFMLQQHTMIATERTLWSANNIYHLALYGKRLPIPALVSKFYECKDFDSLVCCYIPSIRTVSGPLWVYSLNIC